MRKEVALRFGNHYKKTKTIARTFQASLKLPTGHVTGAKGVLQTCSAIVEMIQAKNILDIGLYTGVSALTWATITSSDSKIISMDVDDTIYKTTGKPIVDKV